MPSLARRFSPRLSDIAAAARKERRLVASSSRRSLSSLLDGSTDRSAVSIGARRVQLLVFTDPRSGTFLSLGNRDGDASYARASRDIALRRVRVATCVIPRSPRANPLVEPTFVVSVVSRSSRGAPPLPPCPPTLLGGSNAPRPRAILAAYPDPRGQRQVLATIRDDGGERGRESQHEER